MKTLLILILALFLSACGRKAPPQATETAHFSIEGMTCENCVQGIQSTLMRLPGFSQSTIDLETDSAEILFDPSEISAAELAERITRIGYPTTQMPRPEEKTGDER